MPIRAASSACVFVCQNQGMTERVRAGPRRWWLVLAGFAAGLVASLGHAPFGLWTLGLVGLMAGYLLIRAAASPRRGGLAGWALGLGYFAGTLNWLTSPFLVEPEIYGWMAPFALVFMAGGLALFWGAASGLALWVGGRKRLWLAWPAALGLGELLRGHVFTGFPWGGPGEFWVDTPFLGLAGWTGATGLGVLTFLAAAWGARLFVGPRRVLSLLVLVVAVGGAMALGARNLVREVAPRAEAVVVRLIQPNAPQRLKWNPDYIELFLQRAIDLTGAPGAGGIVPDLVIWPETTLPYLLNDAGPVLREIAATTPAQVVLGVQRAEAGPRYFNSMAVLAPDGSVAAIYDKAHLVPFGEYTPFGGLLYRFGIRGFAAQYGAGYSAGEGGALLDLGRAGKALPLICYEAIFPDDLRRAGRADWILQITNDAWFGTFSGPQQHLAIARLRAAEFGLPFVRAANTGISAVIDARGRIVASLALGEAGFLDVALPGALGETFYAKRGDIILILLLLAVILGLAGRRQTISG